MNHLGGIRSPLLYILGARLAKFLEANEIHLKATYITSALNSVADGLSRQHTRLHTIEWLLHPHVVHTLFRHFGTPQIDLFASHLNHKLPLYISLNPDPQAIASDALLYQ